MRHTYVKTRGESEGCHLKQAARCLSSTADKGNMFKCGATPIIFFGRVCPITAVLCWTECRPRMLFIDF
jgi:hypothetical protein